MRLNNIVKSLMVTLPLIMLSACNSSADLTDKSNVETNTAATENAQQAVEESVQVSAAKRAAEIEEQKRQALETLKVNHIIYFDFDASTLSNENINMLTSHADFLSANPDVNVLVEGHADERGTPEYNIALGERRAKAVVTYLENMGVSSSQISTVSYGEEKPMITDRSEQAFAKNRRAVLVY